MIVPPSDYEVAKDEAAATAQGISHRVRCGVHDGREIGVIRYTPVGRLFWTDVPVERGVGLGGYLGTLRMETGMRPPPPMYQVRVLIERMDESTDYPPMAWCAGAGGHRLPRDLLETALRRIAEDPSNSVDVSADTARAIIKSV